MAGSWSTQSGATTSSKSSNLPVSTASANLPSAASADSLLIALLFVILVIEGRRSAARSQVQSHVNPYVDVGECHFFYRATSAEICGRADKMFYPLFYPPMKKNQRISGVFEISRYSAIFT